MVDVIKKDGRREPFSGDKLRGAIKAAAEEAQIPAARIKQVIGDAAREPLAMAKGKDPVETKTIRDKVLARLDIIEPSVSEAWRMYDLNDKE
jgi:transcriptional regulator NrdR family protein